MRDQRDPQALGELLLKRAQQWRKIPLSNWPLSAVALAVEEERDELACKGIRAHPNYEDGRAREEPMCGWPTDGRRAPYEQNGRGR